MDKYIGSCIIANDNYDILAKTTESEEVIEISNAICENNKVTSIIDKQGKIYSESEFIVYNKVLLVPGIGYLTPGTRVVYEGQDYCLSYGWHTNISNQTILSWYLDSLEVNAPMKTLYKEMIDKIELVHFR